MSSTSFWRICRLTVPYDTLRKQIMLRVVQINLKQLKRASTDLPNFLLGEAMDVALIQELCIGRRTCVPTRKSLDAFIRLDFSSGNLTVVKLKQTRASTFQ